MLDIAVYLIVMELFKNSHFEYVFLEEKSFTVYDTSMFPLQSTFPCEEANIMAEHEKCMKEVIDIFREETLMDKDVGNFKENLQKFTVRSLQLFVVIITFYLSIISGLMTF